MAIIKLDPSCMRLVYDSYLRTLTFISIGQQMSIGIGYTRAYSQTGPISQYEPQGLSNLTVPDDFSPSLFEVVKPFFPYIEYVR